MNLFQRYLVEEFAEDYQEGLLTRRQALKMIASVTGSMVVATTILAACTPPPEEGGVIPTTGASPEVPVTAGTDTPPAGMATGTPAGMESPGAETPTVGMQATGETPPAGTAAVGGTPTGPAATMGGAPGAYGTVMPDDPAVQAGPVEFPGEGGATLRGYQALPVGEGPFALVLVCHENRGLTPHIEDVTRRLAKAGYAALAVDLLSRPGGTATVSPTEVPGVLGNSDPDQFVRDFQSGWQYMQSQEGVDAQRVGMVGFCFGGGVTWRVATQMPELLAAVPFYGPPPPVEDVPNINAAVLAIYGELDERINSTIPTIEAAMQQNNKVYEKVIYPNADHAFHNDTGPRYNPEAAQDAWGRTLAWFEQYLS